MVRQNGHCLGKARAGIPAECRMYYDHKGNQDNFKKSAGDVLGFAISGNDGGVDSTALLAAYHLPRSDLQNWEIGHNRIWAKADK